jgi:hypothetical protein
MTSALRIVGVGLVVALAALAGGTTTSLAVLTSQRAVGGNALATAPKFDTIPPTISGSVIAKTAPYLVGSIKPGGSFYVYANATDAGVNAGLASVTANVGSIKAGGTAVPLAAGTYGAGGATYNYRSASLTADAKPAGTYSYSVTATDNSANVTSASFTVVVDATAPAATDIQTTNIGGGTAGKPELGDTIVFTYSEQIDPQTILSGWTGAATNVVVRFTNNASTDSVAIWNAANSAQLALGSINTNGDYVSAGVTFGASGTASTMTQSGSTIRVTLGTASSSSVKTNATPKAMAWAPSATATDGAGNACSTTGATESGANDIDF